MIGGLIRPAPRVLQNGGARGSREGHASGQSARLQSSDDPERLRVALEAITELQHVTRIGVQGDFTRVAERWVAEIVRERCGLDHVDVQAAEAEQCLVGRVVAQ